jgi:hypothetical protein
MPSPSYYIESEDFTAHCKSFGGGSRNKGKHNPKKGSPQGKYNSKHIRISLEKTSNGK